MQQTVGVDELRPGNVLSEPVKKDDSILYQSGRVLTSEDIVMLKSWRVPAVTVEATSIDRETLKK